MLNEIKLAAKRTEEQLWRLRHELKQKTAEIYQWKQRIDDKKHHSGRRRRDGGDGRPTFPFPSQYGAAFDDGNDADGDAESDEDGEGDAAAGLDVTFSERTEESVIAKKRLEEMGREVQRTKDLRVRLLATVNRHLLGSTSLSMTDAAQGVRVSDGSAQRFSTRQLAARRLADVFRNLPDENVTTLERERYFAFTKMSIAAAVSQLRKFDMIDVERAMFSGLHHVGKRIAVTMLSGELTEEDFERL